MYASRPIDGPVWECDRWGRVGKGTQRKWPKQMIECQRDDLAQIDALAKTLGRTSAATPEAQVERRVTPGSQFPDRRTHRPRAQG